jgi:hypothetical protein
MELKAKVGHGRRRNTSRVTGRGWSDCCLGCDPDVAAALGLVDSCVVVRSRCHRSVHGLVTEPVDGAFATHVNVAPAQFGLS